VPAAHFAIIYQAGIFSKTFGLSREEQLHSSLQCTVNRAARCVHQMKQFAIDAGSGRLTVAPNTPSGGKIPRNLVLTPDGKELLAANTGRQQYRDIPPRCRDRRADAGG
jgi:hypothetical protein